MSTDVDCLAVKFWPPDWVPPDWLPQGCLSPADPRLRDRPEPPAHRKETTAPSRWGCKAIRSAVTLPQAAPSWKSTHGWNVIVQFDRAISSAMVLTSTGLVTW